MREQRRVGVPGSAPGCGAGEDAGGGRGLGARGKGGALSMLLRTPRLALVGAGSVAPGTPVRILALTRSDLWWLGRPD